MGEEEKRNFSVDGHELTVYYEWSMDQGIHDKACSYCGHIPPKDSLPHEWNIMNLITVTQVQAEKGELNLTRSSIARKAVRYIQKKRNHGVIACSKRECSSKCLKEATHVEKGIQD